jgi:hypothetical protein
MKGHGHQTHVPVDEQGNMKRTRSLRAQRGICRDWRQQSHLDQATAKGVRSLCEIAISEWPATLALFGWCMIQCRVGRTLYGSESIANPTS